MVEEGYKFYLSFENSVCSDYVTEKFWKILNLDVIPVVLSGANFAEVQFNKDCIPIVKVSLLLKMLAHIHLED